MNPLKSAQCRHDNELPPEPDEWIVKYSAGGWVVTNEITSFGSFKTRHEAELAAKEANERKTQ